MEFFYPGKTPGQQEERIAENQALAKEAALDELPQEALTESVAFGEKGNPGETDTLAKTDGADSLAEVSSSKETLSVDTEYVLEETDIVRHTVVETTKRLPDAYVGMTREQFLMAMESYAAFPPLAEMERGFVGLEVLSFSREKVVVQMNYQYLQPSQSFYLAVRENEVVVYLEDMETVFINTGIVLEELPEDVQLDIIQMLWIEDEEKLYDFLETYSS